jgi:hypothetical protein
MLRGHGRKLIMKWRWWISSGLLVLAAWTMGERLSARETDKEAASLDSGAVLDPTWAKVRYYKKLPAWAQLAPAQLVPDWTKAKQTEQMMMIPDQGVVWSAEQLRVGSNGVLWLFWRQLDGTNGLLTGQINLWKLANDGVAIASSDYGPYTGWTAQELIVSPVDSKPHVVWRDTAFYTSLWTLGTNFDLEAAVTYTVSNEWAATDYKIGGQDNWQHLLWTHTNQTMSLWTLNTTGLFQNATSAGPYTGWASKEFEVSPVDNKAHLLWTNTDTSVSLWRFSSGNSFEGAETYGPYTNYTARRLAAGNDSRLRLLWESNISAVAVWTLKSNDVYDASAPHAPPGSGWRAFDLFLRPDNGMDLVWVTNQSARVWQLATNGTYVTSSPQTDLNDGWVLQDGCMDFSNNLHLLWVHTSGAVSLWRYNTNVTLNAEAHYNPNLCDGNDIDGNGLLDSWEAQYFGHIGVRPTADPDGDGVNNALEYVQGRDPTKGAVPDTCGLVKLEVFTLMEWQ